MKLRNVYVNVDRLLVTLFLVCFFLFPLVCLALLLATGAPEKFFWALPRFDRFERVTEGVFVCWPVAALMLWVLMRSRWVRSVLHAVIQTENFRKGWQPGLAYMALSAGLYMLNVPHAFPASVLLSVSLFGGMGMFHLREYQSSAMLLTMLAALKFGWAAAWRFWIWNTGFWAFVTALTLLLTYLAVMPALALLEMGEAYPTAHFFRMFLRVYSGFHISLSSFLFAAYLTLSTLYVPGLAFRRALERFGGAGTDPVK